MTVPQTNTGRWAEHAKALERTLVKELGKMCTVTSGEGVPFLVKGLRVWSWEGLQRPGGSDCLLKTQDSAKSQDDV